ncbi:hypothetical protein [uncultured Limosilactobacillus sp.]|uniref:hypothetical protein n=1 Tax=uncultured Limosilactobacillus sp. TaxID=2837629 RepID=UPI0025F91FF2|nr:hypothetical protein [uncultured Limosilactobacillus sp.]
MPQFLGDENFSSLVQNSQRLTLPLLDLDTFAKSYQQIFTKGHRIIESQVLKTMAQATGGYAYAFQILDSLVWESNTQKIDQTSLSQLLPA